MGGDRPNLDAGSGDGLKADVAENLVSTSPRPQDRISDAVRIHECLSVCLAGNLLHGRVLLHRLPDEQF
jgi:hypothetical protein